MGPCLAPGVLLARSDASRETVVGIFSKAAFLAPWQPGEPTPTCGGEKRADATLFLLAASCPTKFMRTYCRSGNSHHSIHCSQGPQDSKFVPGRRSLDFWVVRVEHWARAGRRSRPAYALLVSPLADLCGSQPSNTHAPSQLHF